MKLREAFQPLGGVSIAPDGLDLTGGHSGELTVPRERDWEVGGKRERKREEDICGK